MASHPIPFPRPLTRKAAPAPLQLVPSGQRTLPYPFDSASGHKSAARRGLHLVSASGAGQGFAAVRGHGVKLSSQAQARAIVSQVEHEVAAQASRAHDRFFADGLELPARKWAPRRETPLAVLRRLGASLFRSARPA